MRGLLRDCTTSPINRLPATSSRWMCHRVILASYGDPHAHQSSVMNRGKLLSTFKVDTFIKFSRKMVLSSLVLHACITFTLLSNKELDTFYEEYRVSYPPIINAPINNNHRILNVFLRSWIHGYGIEEVCLPVLYCLIFKLRRFLHQIRGRPSVPRRL